MKSLHIVFPDKQRVEVAEGEVRPPAAGEVLCKAVKSLISTGTETLCLRGVFDPDTNWNSWVRYPFLPGYSMTAEVIEVGEGVSTHKPGDRVAVSISHQQYFTINAGSAYPIPDGVSYDSAAWLSLAKITQVGMRRAELKLGESVGVVGVGQLGQLVVQYLRASGARRIVAIDQTGERLQVAKSHGATHTLQAPVNSVGEAVREITEGKMLDVVFDITGHPAVLAPATTLAKEMGRVVLLGDTTTPSQQVIGPRVVSNSVAILGIHSNMSRNYNGVTGNDMAALFFDYIQQGRMEVESLITHRFSPLDAPQAFDFLVKDRSSAIGVMFDWDKL